MDTASKIPQVEQKTTRPPGILPRHAQAWVIAAIALVMVGILALTGNPPKAANARVASAGLITAPSPAHIEEYQARLDEQTRKLADEQARLAQAKQALGTAAAAAREQQESLQRQDTAPSPAESAHEALQREQEERTYRSLFASNLAVSYRPGVAADGPRTADARGATVIAPTVASALATPAAVAPPEAPKANAVTAVATPTTPNGVAPASTQPGAPAADAGPHYRVFEGTVIETVLTNRLTGAFAGPINCLVTTPVYSSDLVHLVLPAGSRVLGEVRRVEAIGQERLAVAFHRVIRPDGSAASLDQVPGLDQIGETGLQDQIDHHYLQVFGMAAAIGAIAGLAEFNTGYSALTESAGDVFRQGAAASLAQSSMHVLDRYLNVLPTITIREGHRIKVYLTRDLWLPPYPAPTAGKE